MNNKKKPADRIAEEEKRRTDIAESDAETLYERCERIREERDVFFRQCEYALDRAEKAEADLAERERTPNAAALRAAREQGWDQAVDWIRGDQGGPSGRTTNARLANPYRPAQELPTEDGAVIVPAEGHEFIGGDGGRLFARLTYSGQLRLWYGVVINGGPAWAALWYGEPEKITPGTWQVDGQ